ncbi:hypothetical protein DB88DRAFT_496867 [Papiliotrema laurentii]|uniref:Uncharacterized protein n=1 Tax=Papiliotrema laurentii TaxID=5418 RepID=A0AAD9CTU6_PAPLA|nr:hypothetical protein DB88DRAFT_496867 [Papiliotrema laurentii]
MSNRYQPIPTSEDSAPVPQPETLAEGQGEDRDRSHRPLRAGVEAEFNRRPPAWYKRAGLVLAIIFMAWIAIRLGSWNRSTQPKVIYASRYSEEHKYRPAASPVITEYLKDGRIRLRGATVGGVGVREEDLPLSPEKKALAEKKRIAEAREAAKAKLGLNKGKGRKRRGGQAKVEM